jgi:hypothetical protein
VPQDTALTLSNTLTVTTSGVLTIALSGTGNGTISGTIATSGSGIINLGSNTSAGGATISNGAATGTIQTADTTGTMLATLLGSVTAGTVELTANASLGDTTIPSGVTLKVASGQTLTVTDEIDGGSSSVSIINAGTINLGDNGTISGVSGTIVNTGGTIKTGNGTELAALLPSTAKISGGTIEASGTLASAATIPDGVTLLINSGQQLAVNAVLTATGTITNTGTIVLGSSGSISNYAKVTSGTIKVANVDQLEALLLTGGTGIAAGIVETPSVVLAASKTLTVPSGVTLQLGNSEEGGAATLTLTDDSSQLVLAAGGKVNAANNDSTISGIAANGGVTLTATNTNPLVTVANTTNWTITGDTTGTTDGADIVLGLLKISVASGSMEITTNQEGTAAGSLTAGENTTITFAGDA